MDETQVRVCGECRACCHALKIPELDKPAFSTCKCMRAAGCSVYPTRGDACRSYECLWLGVGFGEAEDRPDRLGLMFSEPDRRVFHPKSAGTHMICAVEVTPGAATGARAALLLRRLSQKMVVRLTRFQHPDQLTGPEAMVAEVVRAGRAK